MATVAINGLGRIGRAALKIIMDTPGLELVAVNDIVPIENIVYLIKYDTVYGRYDKTVEGDGESLSIAGRSIRYFGEVEEAATDRYRDILGVTEDPIVSSDIIKDPRASIIDLGMTRVVDGDLVKILSWYDNEWGFTNQMVMEALQLGQAQKVVS